MGIEYLGGCIINDNYPQFGKGDVGTWAPEVWDNIIKKYKIKSVIDVVLKFNFFCLMNVIVKAKIKAVVELDTHLNTLLIKDWSL